MATRLNPPEAVHFFEYGLVGILSFNALKHRSQNPWRLNASSGLLTTATGWFDEALQGLLPNRYYDLRDVGLNALSGILGLVIYQLVRERKGIKLAL